MNKPQSLQTLGRVGVDFHANVTLGFHRNLTHPIG